VLGSEQEDWFDLPPKTDLFLVLDWQNKERGTVKWSGVQSGVNNVDK
jgi:hypothetical protein